MIGNKVIQYAVSAEIQGRMKKIMDTTSVQLPSLERPVDTIKGAGIMGEVEIPSGLGFSPMTATISGRVDSADYAELGAPGRRKYEVRWFTDEYNPSDGAMGMVRHRVVMMGNAKKRDPGKVESNSTQDVSIELAVSYFKNEINGVTVEEVDVFNSKYIVNGVDYGVSLSSFLD